MHSIIIQLSDEPVEECDYIVESDFWEDTRLNYIADYFENINRKAGIDWATNIFKEFADVKDNSIVIKNKKAFFEPRYKEFIKILDTIKNTSLDDFMNTKNDGNIFELESAYNDKYDAYIYTKENYAVPIAEFMRTVNDNDKLYIGGIVGYHF